MDVMGSCIDLSSVQHRTSLGHQGGHLGPPGSSFQRLPHGMEEDSAMVWVLDTLPVCLQQSWTNTSQALPRSGVGRLRG